MPPWRPRGDSGGGPYVIGDSQSIKGGNCHFATRLAAAVAFVAPLSLWPGVRSTNDEHGCTCARLFFSPRSSDASQKLSPPHTVLLTWE